MTHTYAFLEVSPAVYVEVAEKLRSAGYTHAFHGLVIDMHGIALLQAQADPPPVVTDDDNNPDRLCRTYHVGGLLCDEGQSPGGVLAITSRRRPYLDDASIIVGSPRATPLPGAPDRLPKIAGWAMSTATARRLVAILQQAILDVETGEANDP